MAKVRMFRAGYGLSVDIKGSWHKFNAEIEIEIENGDDITDVKKKAFNTVVAEVEKQIKETVEAM